MTVTLDPKQVAWIGDRIREARVEAKKALEAGIHNIAEARAAVEYDDFLNQLEDDLEVDDAQKFMSDLNTTGKVEEPNAFIISSSSLSTEDIGAPMIPEVESAVKDTAVEEMNKAKEKAMEDIFDM